VPIVWNAKDQTYELTPLARRGGALYGIKVPMTQLRGMSNRVSRMTWTWLVSRSAEAFTVLRSGWSAV